MDPQAYNSAKAEYGEEYASLLAERFSHEPGSSRAIEIESLLNRIAKKIPSDSSEPSTNSDLPSLEAECDLANSLIQDSPHWLSNISEKVSDGPKFYWKRYFAVGNEENVAQGSSIFFKVRKNTQIWKLRISVTFHVDIICYLSPAQGWIELFRDTHGKHPLNRYLQRAVKLLS